MITCVNRSSTWTRVRKVLSHEFLQNQSFIHHLKEEMVEIHLRNRSLGSEQACRACSSRSCSVLDRQLWPDDDHHLCFCNRSGHDLPHRSRPSLNCCQRSNPTSLRRDSCWCVADLQGGVKELSADWSSKRFLSAFLMQITGSYLVYIYWHQNCVVQGNGGSATRVGWQYWLGLLLKFLEISVAAGQIDEAIPSFLYLL